MKNWKYRTYPPLDHWIRFDLKLRPWAIKFQNIYFIKGSYILWNQPDDFKVNLLIPSLHFKMYGFISINSLVFSCVKTSSVVVEVSDFRVMIVKTMSSIDQFYNFTCYKFIRLKGRLMNCELQLTYLSGYHWLCNYSYRCCTLDRIQRFRTIL